MSTAAVSSSSIYQELQSFFQQRGADVQQLGKDLAAGNLANAQQDYTTLQSLGQNGPSANGNVFGGSQREQALNAVGQALQANDLAGAQQAFAQLQSIYHPNSNSASASASAPTSSSPGSVYQQLQAYSQQRSADVQQLGQDLTGGNIANAQQDYNALQTLGQSGPSKSGATFGNSQREQDLNAVGQALQSGDLAGAQQAFAQLETTNQKYHTSPPVTRQPVSVPPNIVVPSGSNPTTGGGTEIILNLANAPAGEQITIGLTNQANGNEQVTISAVNPQNQTPEQIALNVNQTPTSKSFSTCSAAPPATQRRAAL
ncbi:MAG: hypothetical protein WA172_17475 [Terriglobales bacterium]